MSQFEEVEVYEKPLCNICNEPAEYDAMTKYGNWAYLCERHYEKLGIGLGLGKGQRLILKKKIALE